MATFYLDQLRNEPTNQILLRLSPATVTIALAGLVPAEKEYNWQQGIEELDQTEWEEARGYLWAAIGELTGESTTVDGGSP